MLKKISDDYIAKLEPVLPKAGIFTDSAPGPGAEGVESERQKWLTQRLEQILAQMRTAWGSPLFEALANKYARDFVSQISLFNDKVFAINVYGDNPLLKNVLNLSIENNVQLIKSIASQHLNAVGDIVYQNVLKGYSPSQIYDSIQSYGVTDRRAKLIAIDQTHKVNSTISRVKQEAVGFKFFKWLTANDERVRESHVHAGNAKTPYGVGVYRWDDLPEVDGEKVSPGIPIRCRCVAVPVLFSEVKDYQKEQGK